MSDLYSVIPGLQPTAQELLEGELLCKQILEAKFPDLDLREGTALRDLVIRPGAMLFALMNKAGEYYFTQNTLSNIDNVTPTEVLDSILSNWFLTRNVGIRSVINARLYFARSKNITVSSSVYFSTDNVTKFFPSDSYSFPSEALVLDSYSNEYYIDMDMIAEREGTSYNISSGSLLYFQNFDPYFLRAEINYLKSESISTETNLEFIARSKTAISTRNLINVPSIDSNLTSEFNFITRLLTIGMGDPEMLRDIIRAMLEDNDPILAPSIMKSQTALTFTIPNHGMESGQRIKITECVPSDYNMERPITRIDENSFSVVITNDYGPILNIPKIQKLNNPVYVHNGGMVDIFCSEKLATSTVQLTSDSEGKVQLTGPIFNFSRSSLSAGDSEDSIPYSVNLPISSRELMTTDLNIITTSPHKLVDGDSITISKVIQEKTINSIISTGLNAVVTCPQHGYVVGDTVVISNAIPEGYNGTYTVVPGVMNGTKFNVTLKSYVTGAATNVGMTCSVNIFNGVKKVTVLSANKFSINLNRNTVGYTLPMFANMEISTNLKYNVINPNLTFKKADNISGTYEEIFVSIDSGHSAQLGRYVRIENSDTPAFNGYWLVTRIISATAFSCKAPGTPNTSTDANATVSYITPWNDVGFSQKQNLIIDFGLDYANGTVSFNIDYFQNLDSIQTYLDQPNNRVLCADYLAKGFNFYKLDIEVTSYNSSIPDPSLVENVIKTYLASLELGGTFIMSDMMSQLRINGIVNIQNPPKVTFSKYTRDLPPVEHGTIRDIMDPKDRTSVFLLNSVNTFAQTVSTTPTSAIIL